jgi:hypothetical protein
MISDRLVIEFDKALRTLFAPSPTNRPVPGSQEPEAALSLAFDDLEIMRDGSCLAKHDRGRTILVFG